MNRIILVLFFLFGLFSCSKSTSPQRYHGIVQSQPNYCTSGSGFPFIIYYSIEGGKKDSVITTTLPSAFKILNQKIVFSMRPLATDDENIACTPLFTIPRQSVVFNVQSP